MVKKSDYFSFVLLGCIFALIALGIYALKVISSEGSQCMASPLDYGVKNSLKYYPTEISCTCRPDDFKYAPFLITKNGTISLDMNNQADYRDDVNISYLDNLIR